VREWVREEKGKKDEREIFLWDTGMEKRINKAKVSLWIE